MKRQAKIWMRWANICLRTLHIALAAVVFGGVILQEQYAAFRNWHHFKRPYFAGAGVGPRPLLAAPGQGRTCTGAHPFWRDPAFLAGAASDFAVAGYAQRLYRQPHASPFPPLVLEGWMGTAGRTQVGFLFHFQIKTLSVSALKNAS